MSFIVLVIGVAHAIPPIVGAALSKTRDGVFIGAAIGALIAIVSGNPLFIAADLVGVGLGTWAGLSMIDIKI